MKHDTIMIDHDQELVSAKPIKKRPYPPLPSMSELLKNVDNNEKKQNDNNIELQPRIAPAGKMAINLLHERHDPRVKKIRRECIQTNELRFQLLACSSERQECRTFVYSRILNFMNSAEAHNPQNYYQLSLMKLQCQCPPECAPLPCPCFDACPHLQRHYCARCIRNSLMHNAMDLMSELRNDSRRFFRWDEVAISTQTSVVRSFADPTYRHQPQMPTVSSVTVTMADKLQMYPDLELVAFEFIVLRYWYFRLVCPVCRQYSKCMMDRFMSPAEVEEFVRHLVGATKYFTNRNL